jgi:hypothetical protein
MKRGPEALFGVTIALCLVVFFTERSWRMPLAFFQHDEAASYSLEHDKHDTLAIIDDLKSQVGTLERSNVPGDTKPNHSAVEQVVAVQRNLDKLRTNVDSEYERGHRDAMKEIQEQRDRDQAKNFVIIAISLIVLVCGVVIVMLERYDEKQKHWAYATVGTIVGFWLR